MCGIIGALAFGKLDKKEETIRREASIFACTQLLQMTVERGKDATGVSMLFRDGNYTGLKMGIPSPDFIARYGETENDFEGILNIAREYPKAMSVFLGHCRKATVGNTYENKNNQPVRVGDIVLIHNGTIDNHNIIFDHLGGDRVGDVDSESIGRLLQFYSNNGQEPFTLEMLSEVTARLDGSYSVLAFNGNNPFQVVQFRETRPAEMVLVKPLKTVFIASEKKFLENMLFEYNKMARLFVPGFKFPYLKKENVEFDDLANDSMGIWDLTVEITDETKIKDLLDMKKNVAAAQKMWKATTRTYSTTYYGGAGAAGGTKSNGGWEGSNSSDPAGANAQSSAASNKTTAAGDADETDDSDDESAFLWSTKLGKFVKESSISTPTESAEIDVNNGKVKSQETATDSDKGPGSLKEAPKETTEGLVCSPVKIEEHGPATESAAETKTTTVPMLKDSKKNEPTTVKMVSMEVDTEAIAQSQKYIEAGLEKFEKDEEVLEKLDVTYADSLKNLPLFALTNRIIKALAPKFFYDGYAARKAEETSSTSGKEVASGKIKTLKTITKILSRALDGFKENKVNKQINQAVETMPRAIKALDLKDLTVLTETDTKNSMALSNVKEKIKAVKKE
jgi:predicted glutamine amidotransferase